jgi:hypothetical protein
MREIKFRGWHITKKIMIPNVQDTCDGLDINWWKTNYSNVILMQYTGLKDKNGKEIYEQDILRFNHLLLRIVWSGTGFNIAGWGNLLSEYVLTGQHDMEVVGNTYENPELETT